MDFRNNRNLCAALCGFVIALVAARSTAEPRSVERDDPVMLQRQGSSFHLQNLTMSARWSVRNGALTGLVVRDRLHAIDIRVDEPFRILLKDGKILGASNLKVVGEPKATHLMPTPNAPRLAATIPGEIVELGMDSNDHAVHVEWSIVLLEGSHYIRQILTIAATGEKDVPISRVQLIDLALPGAKVVGSVDGSPIVAENLFAGFEDPLSQDGLPGRRGKESWCYATRAIMSRRSDCG
jgi:hypothetical protein